MAQRFAVVTCCSGDWIPFACVTLASAWRHFGGARRVETDLHLVTSLPLAAGDRALIDRFCQQHGLTIRVSCLDASTLTGLSVGFFHVSALYRLKLDALLPTSYERVLYLDADTLVLRSLDRLFDVALGSSIVAAVEDVGMLFGDPANRETARRGAGLAPEDPYFNSGVMLFDWPAMRAEQVMAKAIDRLAQIDSLYADQDALNHVLRGRWKRLPLRFNVLNAVDEFAALRPVIRHFTDHRKPWSSSCRSQDRGFRRHYRAALRGVCTDLDGVVAPIHVPLLTALRDRLWAWKVRLKDPFIGLSRKPRYQRRHRIRRLIIEAIRTTETV
ncbi:General stress protein A [Rhodoplanes serenus]|uniref:General stress protein A n=1 Tax=Rhodoplanes serenus TaxID=200615 RepID=A0A447CRA3_9BRAD|nr:glycosyltransferase family 8 protein [Rhodoplanes serenus]VCU07664.1 General stress protein A [Rhodoplanes serenus]